VQEQKKLFNASDEEDRTTKTAHMLRGSVEIPGVASTNRRNISRLTADHSFPRHKPYSETQQDGGRIACKILYYNSLHGYAQENNNLSRRAESVRTICGDSFLAFGCYIYNIAYRQHRKYVKHVFISSFRY
jgi:hypothetical protein